MKEEKIVYIGMFVDLIHYGHWNIKNLAKKKLENVIIRLLTDKAIASYERLPLINFNEKTFKKKLEKKWSKPFQHGSGVLIEPVYIKGVFSNDLISAVQKRGVLLSERNITIPLMLRILLKTHHVFNIILFIVSYLIILLIMKIIP